MYNLAFPAASYPTTLGFAPWVECEGTVWRTARGKKDILSMIAYHARQMAHDTCAPNLSFELEWTEELERALTVLPLPPNAPARPVPREIMELVERFAVTYVTRDRMHARLQTMRERTAVALTPRGGVDVDREELRHETPPNSHYAKFVNAQKRMRAKARDGPSVMPPSRTIPGGASNWRGPGAKK